VGDGPASALGETKELSHRALKFRASAPFLLGRGLSMRTAPSVKPLPKLGDADAEEEERTIRRPPMRAVQQPAVCAYTTRVTRSVEKVDARLIAIARGELDPERTLADSQLPPTLPPAPSSSVIPLTDDDLIEVGEDWLAMGVEPDPFPMK